MVLRIDRLRKIIKTIAKHRMLERTGNKDDANKMALNINNILEETTNNDTIMELFYSRVTPEGNWKAEVIA